VRIPHVFGTLAVLLVALVPGRALARIEAVRGKQYHLTEKHGPWMIMVTSFEATQRQDDARKAADQLVYALRMKGLPAYTFDQEAKIEKINSPDPLGNAQRRVFAAQRPMIAVIAGNYDTVDEKDSQFRDGRVAQQTLKWIKTYLPTVQYQSPNTGETESVRLDLSKAFFTRNPMLAQTTQKKVDPFVKSLNASNEFSLLKNKGRYTLVIASFYGNSQIRPAHFDDFDTRMRVKKRLDQAAHDSHELAIMLRDHQRIRELQLQPYVYHEQYRSIVTVGSFSSPDDPRIDQLRATFQAKYKRNDATGQDVLVAEWVHIPNKNPNAPPVKSWVLDPEPKVIEVPKL
jgi:hypothetical protein